MNPLRRIMIALDMEELEAIRRVAHTERREVRQQIEFFVRSALIGRGLLSTDSHPASPGPAQQ